VAVRNRLALGAGQFRFSHCPWYNLDSAVLKLQESELTGAQREAITHGNARRLLATGAGR
nr:hypothetical protein [Candidatus Anammoximicrobium sp.]